MERKKYLPTLTAGFVLFDQLEQFVTEDVQPVMVVDSVTSSHPIVVNVNNPNQINEVFDSISYSKVWTITHKCW